MSVEITMAEKLSGGMSQPIDNHLYKDSVRTYASCDYLEKERMAIEAKLITDIPMQEKSKLHVAWQNNRCWYSMKVCPEVMALTTRITALENRTRSSYPSGRMVTR